MADNSVIGALRVVLGLDSATFEEGLKKSQQQLTDFGASVAKAAAASAAAVAASASALAVAVQHSLNAADALGKSSQKLGIPVEQLSALQYAAGLADVSMETLSKSMGKLGKAMSATAGGAGGDAAAAFKALHLEVQNTDGTLKSSSDMLAEVAEKFAGLEDSAAKTALAIAIFGKGGAGMIPLLNMGAKGLADASAEAKEFGIIVSTQTAKAAEVFNDNLKKFSAISQGVITQITAGLAPAMAQLSTSFLEAAKNSEGLNTATTVISGFLRGVAVIAVGTGAAFAQMARDWQLVVEVGKNITSLDGIKAAFENWRVASKAANEQNEQVIRGMLGMQSAILPVIDDWTQLTVVMNSRALQQAPVLVSDTTNEVEKFIQSINKSVAAQRAEAETVGMAAGAKERLKVVYEGLQIAADKNVVVTDALRAKLDAAAFSAGNMSARIAGLQSIQTTLPLWDQYQQAIEKSRVEMEAAGATMEQLQEKNKKIAAQFGLTWEQQSASVAGSMSEVATAFAGESRKMLAIAQALSAAQALIATYAAQAQALTLPPPLNFVAGAAILAKGLALVAAIKAVAFSGGGSFKVGGGLTGIDSQMIGLQLAPGEMVDIKKPGQASGPTSGGGVQEISLIGIRPTDLFTGQMLRSLFDSLNAGMKDGYRLQVPA